MLEKENTKSSFETLSDIEKLIFLSGVFEGEGTVYVFKIKFYYVKKKDGKISDTNKLGISISVEMTDEDIIDRFINYFNVGSKTKRKIRKEISNL